MNNENNGVQNPNVQPNPQNVNNVPVGPTPMPSDQVNQNLQSQPMPSVQPTPVAQPMSFTENVVNQSQPVQSVSNTEPVVNPTPTVNQQPLTTEEVTIVSPQSNVPPVDSPKVEQPKVEPQPEVKPVQPSSNESDKKSGEKKKKSKAVPFLVFIIILLIVGIVAMYLYYNGYLDKYIGKSSSNNTSENTKTDDENESVALVSKLVADKDWIYDADYKKNVVSESYMIGEKTYYAKNIVVPFINIDSSYASDSNNEIKKIFDDAITKYNKGVSDKITYIDECNYKKYENDNLVSVILTYGVGATDVVHPDYYTYNFNLKDGNVLSYEEAYQIAGFNSSNINSAVENAIENMMKEKMKDFDSSNYPAGTNFNTYNNESINNYKNSVSSNTLKYFLSDSEKLNIIVSLSIPAGTGKFDTIITVK